MYHSATWSLLGDTPCFQVWVQDSAGDPSAPCLSGSGSMGHYPKGPKYKHGVLRVSILGIVIMVLGTLYLGTWTLRVSLCMVFHAWVDKDSKCSGTKGPGFRSQAMQETDMCSRLLRPLLISAPHFSCLHMYMCLCPCMCVYIYMYTHTHSFVYVFGVLFINLHIVFVSAMLKARLCHNIRNSWTLEH